MHDGDDREPQQGGLQEHEKIKDDLPSSVCNTTAAKEHVSKAECSIQMIKKA